MTNNIEHIQLDVQNEIPMEDLVGIIRQEIKDWDAKDKVIDKITVTMDGDEYVVKTTEKSPIRRIRRITGYLSNVENFNAGKRAEEHDRVKHF